MKLIISLMMVLTILSAGFLVGCGSKDADAEATSTKPPITGKGAPVNGTANVAK